MFIHAVTTPRQITVAFKEGRPTGGNRITLLTGPNGAGKTDILATIADTFHGALQHSAGASVRWSRGGTFHVTESLKPHLDWNRGRVRVIAQTFSPFSRFPGIERADLPSPSPIYARGHSSEEEYVCIGFNQHSQVDLRRLSQSIVENGILRLSEQPRAARVAFDVLEELGFKNGIALRYVADQRLSAFIHRIEDRDEMERTFHQFLRTGHFIVGGEYLGKNKLNLLRDELRREGVSETAELIRNSLHFIYSYLDDSGLQGRYEHVFSFNAFRGREGMSSDFPILQAFSLLKRLGLLRLSQCTLSPYEGVPVDLTQTSSGQQQMLCSIFGLAAALEDDAIVLIDEPELSLHPRWQMNFFKHLETALEAARDCHIILATHSPLIAQAAVLHGAEIIHMGSASENRSLHARNDERTDSSVEELLVDVFDTPIPNSLHISNEIFSLVTKAESGSYADKYEAMQKLEEYLRLYRRDGEGSVETTTMLVKAMRLVSSARPKFDL